MAIEPQIFLCYGRPDKELAHAIATELWNNKIECYNYLAKPIEDRLSKELEHLAYIPAIRLFVAMISTDSIWRELVVQEIIYAHRIAAISEGHLRRVYLSTPAIISQLPFPDPDHLIDRTQVRGPRGIASNLMEIMGSEIVERSQKGWEINKNLYPEAWSELNEKYGASSISEANLLEPVDLLSLVLNKRTIESYLKEDLARISSVENRWHLLKFLARIVAYADAEAAQRLDMEARYLGRPNQHATSRDVGYKEYAPGEQIEIVSQVIRGCARIVNALAEAKCGYAYDIAKRFTWEPTKRVLFCGVFGCALNLGELAISKDIYSSLTSLN